MTFDTIDTPRLQLRLLTPEVFQYIYQHFTDPELMVFLGLDSEEKLAVEKEKFSKGLSTHNKSFRYFNILEKNEGKIIGWCGFHTWYMDHARAEVGYGLYDDAYKKQGIMTEALNYVIQYGFDEMQLHRIEALTATYNIASIKLLENSGFTTEGVLREHYLIDGKWEDSVVFSLLKNEIKGYELK
ncbi:GNAT family N-acetyltransferase [Flavobacterium pallidum]|uniref:N-acetyltransferase n=1 Tax=Flavobacterium pallidum TaxID=2172098 RepID=A0A2S1SID4_9FLAO|nr:GNAT family protein [Flavobacterium pallidum]AWI26174.1 N-acetyltransferase [Flavobacterium pallidum]